MNQVIDLAGGDKSADATAVVSGQLIRNGVPYVVRGVAGTYTAETMAMLKSWGGNTIRLYNQATLDKDLDLAEANGLSVIVGLSYSFSKTRSAGTVQAEQTRILEIVNTYKAHPAVLCWNIGNEQEHALRDNAPLMIQLQQHINAIALAIKAADSLHPVMNTYIDFGSRGETSFLIQEIKKGTPLDMIGVNSYNAAPSLASRYASWKMPIPFIVTELGWSPAMRGRKTVWATTPVYAHEKCSGEKAAHFATCLQALYVSPECLGTIAFRWDLHTNLPTDTWHMLFTPFLMRTDIANELIKAWTGKVMKPAPVILSVAPYTYGAHRKTESTWRGISLDHVVNNTTKANMPVTARVTVNTPDVSYVWELRHHNERIGTARTITRGALVWKEVTTTSSMTFSVPSIGVYRLYLYVEDQDAQSAAYASYPLKVTA